MVMLSAHTLPLIFSTVNMFVLSDAIGYFDHTWIVVLLVIIYTAWNYVFYRLSGLSLYPYLFDWDTELNNGFYFTIKIIFITIGIVEGTQAVVDF